jgi:hypothetical protein
MGTKNTAGAHGLGKSQGEKTNKTNKQTTLISRMSNTNWFDFLRNFHSSLSLSLSLSHNIEATNIGGISSDSLYEKQL